MTYFDKYNEIYVLISEIYKLKCNKALSLIREAYMYLCDELGKVDNLCLANNDVMQEWIEDSIKFDNERIRDSYKKLL